METVPSCSDLSAQSGISIEPDPDCIRPKLLFDTRIGKRFYEVDVDEGVVAQRMKDEGISDETIAGRTFTFTSESLGGDSTTDLANFGDKVTLGKAYKATSDVAISITGILKILNPGIHLDGLHGKRRAVPDVSDMLSSTIFHEIRHVRQYEHGQSLDTRYRNKHDRKLLLRGSIPAAATTLSYETISRLSGFEDGLVSFAVIGLSFALGLHSMTHRILSTAKKYYLEKPSEIDAREAEEEWVNYPRFVSTTLN